MAMGKRTPRQQTMWVNHSQLPKGKGHPFYTRLNDLLAKDGFDAWTENLCSPYFANSGRPSIPPGVYFRMLFIGYLEGFASDRAIAWNCQDRLSLRAFLGIALHEPTPDHSSLTIWRQRLSLDVYRAAFQRILAIVHRQGLILAYVPGVDSTHLAYKSEHAIDLSSGALLAAEIHAGGSGDATTMEATLAAASDNLASLGDGAPEILCAVADKGYHKAELIKRLNRDQGITTYIPEKNTSQRRRWHGDMVACREFHANRRRARGNEGKRLSRLRSWLVERSFAFIKCSGNLARMTLRGADNVAKRYLMHAAGYNLGLVMRTLYRYGTPREMADLHIRRFLLALAHIFARTDGFRVLSGMAGERRRFDRFGLKSCTETAFGPIRTFSTGC